MAVRSFARRAILHVALPVAGWLMAIGGVLLFGLPTEAALAMLLLAVSPALFAPRGRPQ